MKTDTPLLPVRLFGTVALNSAPAIEFNQVKYIPDDTKAYARFTLGRSYPVVTAYGTCVHPGTVGNSFQTMLHQLVDYDHQLKVYNPGDKEKSASNPEIRQDRIIGTVVAVDYPKTPFGGWKLGGDKAQAPAIEGVMVIHKQADKVKQVLGEHLAGRHRWTVSMEMGFSMLDSGFVVAQAAKGNKAQQELMADQTPPELTDLGLGYVAVQSAPKELLDCFSPTKRRIVSTWGGLPVSLMQGGINGEAHFKGIGIVRYGAEREAEINEILAKDPDRLEEIDPADLLSPALEFHRIALSGFEVASSVLSQFLKK